LKTLSGVTTVTDVIAVFKGKGLAGFKKHPFAREKSDAI